MSPYLYIFTKTIHLKDDLSCAGRDIIRKEHVIEGKILALYLSLNSLTNGKNSLIRNLYWKHTQTHKDFGCLFSN